MRTGFIISVIVGSISAALLLTACKQRTITVSELGTYIHDPDNHLSETREIADVTCQVTFKPSALVAAEQLSSNEFCDSLLKAKKQKYMDYYYFLLNVSTNGRDAVYGSQNLQQFSERMQILSFHLPEFIYGVCGKDTISLLDSAYPNMYGVSKTAQILLVFRKPKENKQKNRFDLIINDLGLGIGQQSFSFSQKDFSDIPEVTCGQ